MTKEVILGTGKEVPGIQVSCKEQSRDNSKKEV